MFGMSPTFDQGLSPAGRGSAIKNTLLVFNEIDATNLQSIDVPFRRKVQLVAELYGGGGPGAGGGYNTGGGSGGGGACTVFEGIITGPCKIVLQPGGSVPGAIYGSTSANDGNTSQLSLLYDDGSAAVVTTALGGRRGTVNPVTSAAGGPPSQQGRVAGAQFEGTVRSFVGGASSTASGRPVGFPAGPDGAANGNVAGAGNRSGTFGRGGAGDSTLNSGSTSTGSPGAAGRIFAKGVR